MYNSELVEQFIKIYGKENTRQFCIMEADKYLSLWTSRRGDPLAHDYKLKEWNSSEEYFEYNWFKKKAEELL